MKNIESFNVAVAEAFGQCYQAFPLRIDLSVIEIGETVKRALDPNCDTDIDMRSIEYVIAKESIGWLVESGYLWQRNASNTTFYAVTLSPKGLEVLNAIPQGIVLRT